MVAAMTLAGGASRMQTATAGAGPASTQVGTLNGGALAVSANVDPRDFPDPFVLKAGASYFAFGTNAGDTHIQVMASTDLIKWHTRPDALPNLPRWAAPGFTWSPTVLARGDRYVLYYSVRQAAAHRQAISVASASSPGGPYVDASRGPLIYQPSLGGSIDASPFVDTDGRAYLLWKSDGNAINQPSSLWVQGLDRNGLSLTGQPSRLLGYDDACEAPLIEAPSLVLQNGTYFLFYSIRWWNTSRYAIGYATASSLRGPYTKVTTSAPWFASDGSVAGPGGQEWFIDSAGALRMVYHGWQPGRVGYPAGTRSMRLAWVTFYGGAAIAS
jgi:beta-xylosidase